RTAATSGKLAITHGLPSALHGGSPAITPRPWQTGQITVRAAAPPCRSDTLLPAGGCVPTGRGGNCRPALLERHALPADPAGVGAGARPAGARGRRRLSSSHATSRREACRVRLYLLGLGIGHSRS